MQTTIIRDWTAFDRLEPEWNELLFRSRAASIFLTWEWISAWCAGISDSVSPFVIVVRDESEKLIGVAPLYLSSMRFLKVLRYRMLRYMRTWRRARNTRTGSFTNIARKWSRQQLRIAFSMAQAVGTRSGCPGLLAGRPSRHTTSWAGGASTGVGGVQLGVTVKTCLSQHANSARCPFSYLISGRAAVSSMRRGNTFTRR